jgi:hypothetical protein
LAVSDCWWSKSPPWWFWSSNQLVLCMAMRQLPHRSSCTDDTSHTLAQNINKWSILSHHWWSDRSFAPHGAFLVFVTPESCWGMSYSIPAVQRVWLIVVYQWYSTRQVENKCQIRYICSIAHVT